MKQFEITGNICSPALGTKLICNALCLEWMRRILFAVFVIVITVFAFLLVGGVLGMVKSFGFLVGVR